jgi:superfamily II helicase
MLRDDKLNHVYERFKELDSDKAEIKKRLLTEKDYTKEQFQEDLDILKAKKDYLEERLKLLLNINAILKEIKNNPKQATKLKIVENPKQWEIFKNNLKVYQWVPFEGEICDFCGRTQSSTTAVAAAILPSGNLDIICSRCFAEQLKTETSKYGE